MDIDAAAQFLVSSILIALGTVSITVALVFINNLLSKYWKPVKIWVPSYFEHANTRFMTDEEAARINQQTPTKKD
jgi:hypothetical protein